MANKLSKKPKLSVVKKTKTKQSQSKIRDARRLRLEGIVIDLRENRNGLKDKIRKQTGELKLKNGQIRDGEDKQVTSDLQIDIITKAMESATDGIFIIDATKYNFPVIYANRSFQKMTGYPKREILGRNYFLVYGPDADRRVIYEIKQTIHKGRPFYGEMLNFSKKGNKYWNSLRITPVLGRGGSVTHYIGIQADVTLMREKQLEIDEQRDELLHVTRVGKLSEFVSSLSHEISQPLTSILSYAQAAKRMLAGREPAILEILQYIIDDDKRANEVIQRLRLMLKKGTPKETPIDINFLISETVALISTDAVVRGVTLKFITEDNLPLIIGDRIQLQQVILNLISNSFDALEDSKTAREILIRTSRKGTDAIVVEVKDSGCGIPARNIPKLFSHFFTSKPDGLGMGLSISRSIIESHGGRLDVDNNSDEGAVFYITIPIATKVV